MEEEEGWVVVQWSSHSILVNCSFFGSLRGGAENGEKVLSDLVFSYSEMGLPRLKR